MANFKLRLKPRRGQIQLASLIVSLVLGILISIGITVGAFVLSFAVLRDLAQQAGIPHSLTWIFPLIVDGAIMGATIAVVTLSKIDGVPGKRFFKALAVIVVFISVVGNAYHADQWATRAGQKVAAGADLGYTPLSPIGAALIAVIAPLLVLAFTHGCGILIRAIGIAQASTARVQESRDQEQRESAVESEHRDERIRQTSQHYQRNATDVAPVPGDIPVGVVPIDVPVAAAASTPVGETADSAQVEDLSPVALPTESAVADVADADSVADIADLGQQGVVRNAPSEDSQELYVLPDEEQTIENLLAFIDSCDDFEPVVKETARLRITENLSYAEIATITRAKASSTAMRRFDKVAHRAVDAGFRTPPLPEVDDATDIRNAATPDQQYALVGAR
ncbi:DUF2637 domain-containing protein (plasmid) [Rhodococcus pseudokoreensis]|uniref:DUF2637 domain-containing protein n=1 Tax=Rhodococcus pseudokoreensis TaxID=2811421 RepID=A0A974VYS9_9NOCA|nr:DUF2637 domain-containing protein [Rhodococcus pseudokoreensis]QSE88058.1 DUF2637 domain-containing protein [Rhodococcus pseudokoreensis]